MYTSFSEDILTCSTQQIVQDAKIRHIASGKELVDLSMVNPDISPARVLIDKLVEASVKSGSHRYSISKGIKKLRNAFSEKYEKTFGVKLNPETNICITMGTKDALVNTLAVISGYCKSILLPAPTYPAYLSAVEISGLKPIFYDICQPEDKILAEIAEKIKTNGCKIVLLNFPNNPTGVVVSPNFYAGLKKELQDTSVIVINDFVYGEMAYSTKAEPSLLSLFADYEYLIEIYSLSKAYAIPGWRIAAAMGNAKIIERLVRLKSHIDYGIFLPLQSAACHALSNPQIAAETAGLYKKRHKLLAASLKKLKWEVFDSKGGAVLWAKTPEPINNYFRSSLDFCLELLSAKGVVLTPGIIFGKEYDQYVRIALVTSEEKLYEISKKIAQFQKQTENNLKNQNAA